MNFMTPETNTECKTCKKGLSTSHYLLFGFSLFMLSTSIYGTIKLIGNIITYFSH